jgi:hypothetical protein
MNASDEIRKTLSDPKPLYALVGAGDLAAEKLKDAPERLRDAPTLLAEASATLTTIANKIASEAPERFAKLSSTVQDATGKAARPDTQALRGAAQTVALQQVGRLLEAAGKAVETYDELAERGKVIVDRYTGTQSSAPGENVGVDDNGPVKVVVEQVVDEDEILDASDFESDPARETAEEAAEVFEAAAEAEEEIEREAAAARVAEVKKASEKKAAEDKAAEDGAGSAGSAAKAKPAAAKKTTSSTPRKRAASSSSTAPKTPRPPKA